VFRLASERRQAAAMVSLAGLLKSGSVRSYGAMRTVLVKLGLVILVAGAVACATRGFVQSEVGKLSGDLSQSLEQTQDRTEKNDAAIKAAVDKTVAVEVAANIAQQTADTASGWAAKAMTSAWLANRKADDLAFGRSGRMYLEVLNEDQGGFAFNGTELSEQARIRLGEIMDRIGDVPTSVYFEVEGHTDNVGPAAVNMRIGLERAEAVRRYLTEEYFVPLHRISVISYGATRPIASNATRDGRAQNRRIVLRVIE
jgi:outer membrane protein OmpA-like peptidoglycan-associated protein